MDILDLIGRDEELFDSDIVKFSDKLSTIITKSSFLVFGGAGTIGQAVTKEIFKREPPNFMLLILVKII